MEKIDAVLSRFPQHAYDPNNKSSALYKLIKAIVDEFNITMSNIDKISKMINVDTVLPDDIYERFGALLNINKNKNETDEQYRNRLKTSVVSLSGGTANAIRYAIACGLGINDDPIAMDRIKIYDAWKYEKHDNEDIIKDLGYIVCEIDLNNQPYLADTREIVVRSANDVKAAGTIMQFIYYNYRILYYSELSDMTYISLNKITYSQVGE